MVKVAAGWEQTTAAAQASLDDVVVTGCCYHAQTHERAHDAL